MEKDEKTLWITSLKSYLLKVLKDGRRKWTNGAINLSLQSILWLRCQLLEWAFKKTLSPSALQVAVIS